MRKALVLLAALAAPSSAWCQVVALQGILGSRALLVVDGSPPKSVAAGETHQGVKVISTSGDQAVVEYGGQRHSLRVGDSPGHVAGSISAARGNRIVLTADSGGHFMATGAVNGRAVQFMVDTGATSVAMGLPDAQRIGLNYAAGQPIQTATANGVATGWRVKLNSVRIGDVEVFEVDAIVLRQPMPFLLLGNSFLTRFQMKRENDQMVLERRY